MHLIAKENQKNRNPYYCEDENELSSLIQSEINKYLSKKDLYYQETEVSYKGAGKGFAAGAAGGAIVGSIVPVIGTLFGAFVGGLLASNATQKKVYETVDRPTEVNNMLGRYIDYPNRYTSNEAKKLKQNLNKNTKFFADLLSVHIKYSNYKDITIDVAKEYIEIFTEGYNHNPKKVSEPLAEMYYCKAMCLFNGSSSYHTEEIIQTLDKYEELKPNQDSIKNIKISVYKKATINLINEKKYLEAEKYLHNIFEIDSEIVSSDFDSINNLDNFDEELNIAASSICNFKGENDNALDYLFCALYRTNNSVRLCNMIYYCVENIYSSMHRMIIARFKKLLCDLSDDKKSELLKVLNGMLVLLYNDKEYELVYKYILEFENDINSEIINLKISTVEQLLIEEYQKNNISESIKYAMVLIDKKTINHVNDFALITALNCFIKTKDNKNATMLFDYLYNKLGGDIRIKSAKAKMMLGNNDSSDECYNLCLETYKSFEQNDGIYFEIIFEIFGNRMLKDNNGQAMLFYCFSQTEDKSMADVVVNVITKKEERLDIEALAILERAYAFVKSTNVLRRLAVEYSHISKPALHQYKTIFSYIDVSINPDYFVLVKACNFLISEYELDCIEIKYLNKIIDKYSYIKTNYKKPYYEYCTYLGAIYKKYGQYEKAEMFFSKALLDNSEYIIAGYEEIDVLLKTAKYNKANELINFFSTKYPEDDKLLVYKGKYYYYYGDILNSEKAYEKALLINPQQLGAREGIAQLGNMTAERQKTIEQYINIIQINQNDLNAHLNIGVMYLQLGKNEDAVIHLEKAIRLNSEMLEPYIYLIQICIKNEELDKAKAYYEKIKKIEEEVGIIDETTRRNIKLISALLDQNSNNIKGALQKYISMIKLYVDDYRLYNNLAALHFLQDNLKEFEKALNEALKIDSGNELVEGNLKLPLLCQRNFKEYIEWFENSANQTEKIKFYALATYIENGSINKAKTLVDNNKAYLLNKTDKMLYKMLETIVLIRTEMISIENIQRFIEELRVNNISNNIIDYFENLCQEVSYNYCHYNDKVVDDYKDMYYRDKEYTDGIYNRLAKRIKIADLIKYEELPSAYKGMVAESIEDVDKLNVFEMLNIKVAPVLETTISSYGDWEVMGSRMEGGMAYVTKVFNRKRNICGALKELKPKLVNNKSTRDSFRNEAYFLSDRLNHKNIVRVFSDSIDVYKCSYVMEYLNGGSLRKAITSNKPSEDEIATVLHSVFTALSFFHNLGERYIHLDVTPENIMFTENGKVKLTDFGISYFRASSDIDYTDVEDDISLAGKLPYMAPEILSGDLKTQKADQYSLGVVAYELYGGKLPYEPEDKDEATEFAWILSANEGTKEDLKELNTNISHKLSEIIHKMINPNPDERYSSIDEALSDFKSCFGVGYSFDEAIKYTEVVANEDRRVIEKVEKKEREKNQYSFENWSPVGYRKTGATCHITKVYNEKLDTYGALKILKPEYINNNALKEDFLSEAYFLSKNNGRGLIKVYHESIDDNKICYVMEWVDGKTLSEIVFNDAEILSIFINIAKIVAEFHSTDKKFVHLDISPQNIMVSNQGQVYLLDFGSGYYGQKKDVTNGRKGKYPYIAPEIYKNNEISQKADVFSLGVVFFKMLTGKFPIQPKIENAPEHIWANAIINEKIPELLSIRSNLNKHLSSTIMKMLIKDPRHRIEINDLISELEIICGKGGLLG